MKNTPKNINESLSEFLANEGHSIQSPSDQTTGWSVAESKNDSKDMTDHIIKDIKGDFWIDILDPDTEAFVAKPGDSITFKDDEGVLHSGTITTQVSPTENLIYKVEVATMDLDETTNEHHMSTREDKINYILQNQRADKYEPWTVEMLGYLADVDLDKVYAAVESEAKKLQEIEDSKVDCPYCNGTGEDDYSNCCGAKMSGLAKDYGICPECREHTSTNCQMCDGTGKVDADEVETKLQEADKSTLARLQGFVVQALSTYIPDHLFLVELLPTSIKISIDHSADPAGVTAAKELIKGDDRLTTTWSPLGYAAIVEPKSSELKFKPDLPVVGNRPTDEIPTPNSAPNTDLDEVFGNILKGMDDKGHRPSDETPKPVEPVKENASTQDVGLIVVGSSQLDNVAIGKFVEQGPYHAEWNAREHYWFFPEAEETIDALEMELDKEFAARGINARFEGQFEEVVNSSNNNPTDYDSMSDTELMIHAHTIGAEECIVKDLEGGLANRDEIIGLLKADDQINEIFDTLGHEDNDVNNDGKVDSTDDYLKHRRSVISRNIGEQNVDIQNFNSPDNNPTFSEGVTNSQKKKARAALSAHLADANWQNDDKAVKNINKQREKIMKATSYKVLVNILGDFGYRDEEIAKILGKEKTVKEGATLIKEYLVKEGSVISDVFGLNLFEDMTNEDYTFADRVAEWKSQGFDTSPAEAVYSKYRPIAQKFESLIDLMGNRRLTHGEAELLDQTWYDGSDAYDTPESFADYMPEVYDSQITALKPVMSYDILNEKLGPAEKFATVEKTKKGFTYVVAYPNPTSHETEEGLYAWEAKDNANRAVYFAKDEKEAKSQLKTL